MYIYNQVDQQLVEQRVNQFRQQTRRFLDGHLDEEVFKQIRLRNGLYIQRHAPMLRVAVPYGVLSSEQLGCLAAVARNYDRGYAHVTTRQNFQFNWPHLKDVPEILSELAQVQMHAIQTSGNCIRNVTSDPLAGVAADELEDPRVWCELIRQWSTLHPEFSFLPRKFKFAVTGAIKDRVALQVHDIGLQLITNALGEIGFKVLVGGGMGRTPVIGQLMQSFLPRNDLISYLEAILRVYNRYGRRDNPYKARIKILVKALGIDAFRKQVDAEWLHLRDTDLKLDDRQIAVIASAFKQHQYRSLPGESESLSRFLQTNPLFSTWYRQNTREHKISGYRIVYLPLKDHGLPPGDISAAQMDAVADLAWQYSMGEIRTTYRQNMVFAQVEKSALHALWCQLNRLKLATPSISTCKDIICCPGLDFCSLANATSIDVSEDIMRRFSKLDQLHDIGDIRINISGCMNACGHHHVGNIGILGVNKKGQEWYQITLGGSASNDTTLGKVLGPSLSKVDIGRAVETIIQTYLELRLETETFLQTLHRLGNKAFKERVYADTH